MKRGLVAVVLAGAALAAAAAVVTVSVSAHHSFAATYFEEKTQTVEGDMVQFVFRNPHSFVHLEAPDESGQMQRWAVEWGSGMQLSGQGVANTTLKPGDHVIVVGAPGRNSDDHRMRMHTITRPSDGWKWTGTFQ